MSETKGTALDVLSLTTEIAERIGRHLSRMERSAQKVNGYSMAVNPDGNRDQPACRDPRSRGHLPDCEVREITGAGNDQ